MHKPTQEKVPYVELLIDKELNMAANNNFPLGRKDRKYYIFPVVRQVCKPASIDWLDVARSGMGPTLEVLKI